MSTLQFYRRHTAGSVVAAILSAMSCLAGCATGPVTHTVYLKGELGLNPNSHNKSTPVNVRIYQLNDSASFESADFDSLWEHGKNVLADSLVNMTEHVVTVTQDEAPISLVTKKDVLFMGGVGLFNQQRGAWKQWVPVHDVEDWQFLFSEFHIDKVER